MDATEQRQEAVKPKQKNPHRLTVREMAEDEGMDVMEFAEQCASDSVCPACCRHGCMVEPDGRCPHDCPSVLLALGVI